MRPVCARGEDTQRATLAASLKSQLDFLPASVTRPSCPPGSPGTGCSSQETSLVPSGEQRPALREPSPHCCPAGSWAVSLLVLPSGGQEPGQAHHGGIRGTGCLPAAWCPWMKQGLLCRLAQPPLGTRIYWVGGIGGQGRGGAGAGASSDFKARFVSSVENTTHCEFAYLRDLLIR